MNLTQLAEMEDEVLAEIKQLPWDVRYELDPRYEPQFRKYCGIHTEYAFLADKDIEALKRGLFIQWFAYAEPSALSGISVLDPESMRAVAVALDARLEADDIDEELRWMFSHYVGVADFAFDQFKDLKYLNNFILSYSKTNYPVSIDRVSMRTRGGMGRYWSSMANFS
ncbi:MAG: hypothetical protein EOO89_16735 [Pedobacter sp.]|nr:MAG: hypothetical protein EOO89_16735 [Pedobacter sp.]